MTLPASPTGRSGQVQDPPSGGDLCRVGARPVGPSDSPGVVSGRPAAGPLYYRATSPAGSTASLYAGTGKKASGGRFSRTRRTILRNEKSSNHGPAPWAPRTSGEPAGHEVDRWPGYPASG